MRLLKELAVVVTRMEDGIKSSIVFRLSDIVLTMSSCRY